MTQSNKPPNRPPNRPRCLVILAGGQSRRMGQPKATLRLGGERLIDRVVSRYQVRADYLLLSASDDLGTGLGFVPDDPGAPDGPVGAIFTLAERLPELVPGLSGFATIPVDAPFVPDDLVSTLLDGNACAIAEGKERLHPTFGYWRCDIVSAVMRTHDLGTKTPSLQWLARQCDARTIPWPDERAFLNINTPDDLRAAQEILER